MSDQFHLRQATIDDAEIIGYHRALIFHDMGQIPEHLYKSFQRRSQERVHEMLISGEYVGWLAIPASTPEKIVAGAGVQLRTVLPHPATDDAFAEGSQAVIINVFTEPDWRRLLELEPEGCFGSSSGHANRKSIDWCCTRRSRVVAFTNVSGSSGRTRCDYKVCSGRICFDRTVLFGIESKIPPKNNATVTDRRYKEWVYEAFRVHC
jgi:hypothetical protein